MWYVVIANKIHVNYRHICQIDKNLLSKKSETRSASDFVFSIFHAYDEIPWEWDTSLNKKSISVSYIHSTPHLQPEVGFMYYF